MSEEQLTVEGAREAKPLKLGELFGSLVYEMHSVMREVKARREFDEEVGEYLKAREITADFEEWRTARNSGSPPSVEE